MILVKSFMLILLLFFIYYLYDKTQQNQKTLAQKESFTDIKNNKEKNDIYSEQLQSQVNELIKLKEKANEIVSE